MPSLPFRSKYESSDSASKRIMPRRVARGFATIKSAMSLMGAGKSGRLVDISADGVCLCLSSSPAFEGGVEVEMSRFQSRDGMKVTGRVVDTKTSPKGELVEILFDRRLTHSEMQTFA